MPGLCDAWLPWVRAGALPSSGSRLATSVNQQTLPRACSGLSTFWIALGGCGEGSQGTRSSGEPGQADLKLQTLQTW